MDGGRGVCYVIGREAVGMEKGREGGGGGVEEGDGGAGGGS